MWWSQVRSMIMGIFFFFKIFFGFSSVVQLCPTLCDRMDCSTPALPVHRQTLEFTQTYVHWVSDAIQPFHPLSSHFFKHLYWICHSIASVFCFVFFGLRHVGSFSALTKDWILGVGSLWPPQGHEISELLPVTCLRELGTSCLPPKRDLFEHRGDHCH